MDAATLKAAHPEPFVILGKRLKPFSMGHELLFQRFLNGFSVEKGSKENPPGLFDLLTGVYLCSQEYVPDRSLDDFSVSLNLTVRRIISFGYKGHLSTAYALFLKYIHDHTELPEFYVKGEQTADETGVPTIQAVKVSLMHNLGYSAHDAMNMSFSCAFREHYAFKAMEGRIQIVDDAERERMRKAQENSDAIEDMKRQRYPQGGVAHA